MSNPNAADETAQPLEAEQALSNALSRAAEQLAAARSDADVIDVLRRCTRGICRADGVAVILRDGGICRHVAEDAIGPLSTGQSFSEDICISGWVMRHARTTLVADTMSDDRVPPDLYRDSFARSLAMTPVGFGVPTAALGLYWAKVGYPAPAAVKALEELARLASVAFHNVALYQSLARELAASNRQLDGQTEEGERVAGALRQMQHLEAVGQLTSGVAHEFNNLLTVILGNLGFIQRGLAGTPMAEKLLRRLGFLESAAERGTKLTAQLLAFSRRRRLEPKPVDLNGAVNNLHDLLRSTMGGAVRIETILSPHLWAAVVDTTQVELAILSLGINARDAMRSGGRVTVETSNVALREAPRRAEEPEPGDYVVVAVRDTGSGMTDEVRARAFEPFFTTKDAGEGRGLGLSRVLAFAKQSGGGVSIDSMVGGGTTVRVFVPRAAGKVATGPVTVADEADGVSRMRGTILLVDDDTGVREVTSAMLREAAYTVIEAGSGVAGLEALDRTAHVDLLLVDFAMPGMNGGEVAREAAMRRPGLPILFVTGYADLEAIRLVGEDRIVAKPFEFDHLLKVIDQALRHKREPIPQ